MPPRRKRIRSDDSENSTVDSFRSASSGSDIQKNAKNLRHQSKKVIVSEGYDGDCELDRPGKNRVTKTGTRTRVLKQKSTNDFNSDSSSPTVIQMDVDMLGFENLTTPFPESPIPRHLMSTPQDFSPEHQQKHESVLMASPKALFETPVEKSVKKFKRKRLPKYRQSQNRDKMLTEEESVMIAQFNDIDKHKLVIE